MPGVPKSITPPSGWGKIPVNLNLGAGGNVIYLCYKSQTTLNAWEEFVADISIQSSKIKAIAETERNSLRSAVKLGDSNGDINQGCGGNYIYLFKRMGNLAGIVNAPVHPITGIGVLYGDSNSISAPAGWIRCPEELNKNAGGKFIYLIYTYYANGDNSAPGVPYNLAASNISYYSFTLNLEHPLR